MENGDSGHRSPAIAVDVIVEMEDGRIVIIKRLNDPVGFALPGGFVDYGETLEHAAAREVREELNIEISDLRQMRAYSKPDRDPRGHTITMVFIARGHGEPRAGSDAAQALLYHPEDGERDFVFDHGRIIQDYLRLKNDRTREQ